MPYPKSKTLKKNDHPLKALNAKQIEQLDERVKQLGKDNQEEQTNINKSASNTVTNDA